LPPDSHSKISIFDQLLYEMPKAKSAAEMLQIARERGSEQEYAIIDDNPVHKKLQPHVEKRYERENDLQLE